MSSVVLLTSVTYRCFPRPFVLREDENTRRSSSAVEQKGGDGLRPGWESFAKLSVEKSSQHLLLFVVSKTGNS